MAPIYAAAVGITPQIIDDLELRMLRSSLVEIAFRGPLHREYTGPEEVDLPLDIESLVSLLEPCQTWSFEEQVDLQEWIDPLNKIDACLSYYIQKYPSMLLIGPVKRAKSRGAVKPPIQLVSQPSNSVEEANKIPGKVYRNIHILLRFLSALLLNASNKAIFNTVEELVDLLACEDDDTAALALETLSKLATPPALHKQQAPEVQQHATALHNSRTSSHKRLMALARGWGTRGSGLGLYTCVTADDSEFGQGALPKEAGELNFAFFKPLDSSTEQDITVPQDSDIEVEEVDDSYLVRISLHKKDILEDSTMATDSLKSTEEGDEANKRRRVAPVTLGENSIRSTAQLFFACLEKAGGRDEIPEDRLFPLLADIRLTRSFYCRAARIKAIERRLHALITTLHAHPSQEIMSGYFQAQPELCVELIDLLRPTVSSATVSAASSNPKQGQESTLRQDAISTLASSLNVPYLVRKLALESLTALVARRDGTSGSLTGVARHSNVMAELGVGKGQYLGLLPTLIRFSLAALRSSSGRGSRKQTTENAETSAEDTIALEVGLAFVKATAPPQLPRAVQVYRAFEFIDSVLDLTSAVVATPSGTSALTDCGLIPALLTTVALDSQDLVESLLLGTPSPTAAQTKKIKAVLRFITAQAVQILEGAIVTHSSALSAFHDLQGVEVLTNRLSKEILDYRQPDEDNVHTIEVEPMECDSSGTGTNVNDTNLATSPSRFSKFQSSHRVLLFSIVTCLTIIFHQESTSSSAGAPSGATELRKDELTASLIDIISNVEAYGGVLVSLIATLMTDVMNSDPHVVHHVHKSGLARCFMRMLLNESNGEPTLPPVPELIMSIPNVLSALSLTEDGAKAVKEANPFPALLRLFCHPKYAMPRSRCLLNEMTAIVGTGLDEIMRHVESLKPLICKTIAESMNRLAEEGEQLHLREAASRRTLPRSSSPASNMENERSCLMQYALNFGQMLEQILHNEEHCDPFVSAGGLDALLKLYPHLMPTDVEFLAHTSCLSCPSVSTLTHSTTEDSLTLAFKCISLRYDSFKLLQTMINYVNGHLTKLETVQAPLRKAFPSAAAGDEDGLSAAYILEGLPREPIYNLLVEQPDLDYAAVANYLRQVVIVQWMTSLLAVAIKACCQRSQDTGTGWSRAEREWKKELTSTAFEELVGRLSRFHQSSIFEVCRLRTEADFEERDKKRLQGCKSKTIRYRLRIVCPEGAVVRDGIEIDSCASVGNMEMGEIADAFDRCVNSSGVLRYRTQRGWVSEQTRGHGREPIAEVLNVWVETDSQEMDLDEFPKGRVEAGVPDMCTTGANLLARAQASYSELFSSLSRVIIQGVRSLPVRTVSFQQGTIGAHAATIMKMLTTEVANGLNKEPVVSALGFEHDTPMPAPSCCAMYLGCMLSHLQSFLFEEKRERRTVNIPLLIALLNHHESNKNKATGDKGDNGVSFLDAIDFVLRYSLKDFALFAKACDTNQNSESHPRQRVSRTTASCLPPAISMLRRLIAGPSITTSPVSSVLCRVKTSDLSFLLGERDLSEAPARSIGDDETFSPEKFVRALLCNVSETVMRFWQHPAFIFSPPHIVHPIATLVGDIIIGLEDATKKSTSGSTARTTRDDRGLWTAFRGLNSTSRSQENRGSTRREEEFEVSEDAISRLTEMGFSRDHAWDAIDSTSSNQLEVAMEYALSHPPPTAEEIERRRSVRESRRQQRQREAQAEVSASQGETDAQDGVEGSAVESQEIRGSSIAEEMEVDTPETPDQSQNDHNETPLITQTKGHIEEWKVAAYKVSCDILAEATDGDRNSIESFRASNEEGGGNGELEALTVVLSSFLLDLCQRYPSERMDIATVLFLRLKTQFTEEGNGDATKFSIAKKCEASFSALCHSAVLFTRALPNTRKLILREGLIRRLVSSVSHALRLPSGSKDGGRLATKTQEKPPMCWPMWLAPALLLLDIMAQPVVAFSTATKDEMTESSTERELEQVRQDHKNQLSALASLAKEIFACLYPKESGQKPVPNELRTSRDLSSATPATTETKLGDDCTDDIEQKLTDGESQTPFELVPAYFPLLPSPITDSCVDICIHILSVGSGNAPPGVVHGTLLLLMRLLRTPRVSTRCLKAGVAEKILSLPRKCRFTGHSGLVTLIFRRLLEDEPTLLTAMETEIRGTITKLHGKKENHPVTDKAKPTVSRRAFVQAVIPLMCREPTTFLKSVAVSVLFEKDNPEVNSDPKVTLLSSSERTRNLKIVSDLIGTKNFSSLSQKIHNPRRSSSLGRHKKSTPSPRSKTPTRSNKRGHTPKRTKREKVDSKEKHEEETKGVPAQNSPASHITGLLVNAILQRTCKPSDTDEVSTATGGRGFGFESSFLWTANVLEILADLVLAIPASATAIHKFRPAKGKDRGKAYAALLHPQNALQGCNPPPKTVVSFLLHSLLVQDRWSNQKDKHLWQQQVRDGIDNDEVKDKKRAAFQRTKVAQSTARLLVALVARPGEGRRRVVAELVFALSGGQLGLANGNKHPGMRTLQPRSTELHALHAWGDLCLGLAAPRTSANNYDSISTLSIEVVELMLEYGMAHALLVAIHRVPLHHPMANTAVAALILPFEILSRPSVSDAVKTLVEKEASVKLSKTVQRGLKHSSSSQPRGNVDGSQQHDSFADDHLLEEAFGVDSARRQGRSMDGHFVANDERSHNRDGSHPGDFIDAGDNTDEEDMEEEDNDMEIDDGMDDEDSDEDMSSSEESDESSDVDDSEDDDGDDNDVVEGEDDEDVDSGLDESDDTQSGDEFGQDDEFNVDYREDAILDPQEYEVVDEDDESPGLEESEGWTRIESNGFGGMLLGSRRGIGQQAGGFASNAVRSRGFIDAAEAMIGTLLRTGEIQGDALAEIEGSLGIRIMPNSRQFTGMEASNRGAINQVFLSRPASGNRVRGDRGQRNIIGTLPHVQQRNQPDVGYSSMGGGGRWTEISSMEYVYGGPSITAGSRNYDLVSPVVAPPDDDGLPSLSQVDGQLFPGGPAAATHARTQHALHPLLCGVDLPPVNALVVDLLPHGVRATRRGQMATRRPGDWTSVSGMSGGFLVSTSNGSIIRSNRSHNGSSLPLSGATRGFSGPLGWTDDGLPVDATIEDYSSAFERALGASMSAVASRNESENENIARPESENENSNHAQDDHNSNDSPAEADQPSNSQGDVAMGGTSTTDSNDGMVEAEASEVAREPTVGEQEANDDGVSSSLATGLRLSPDVQESTGESNAEPQPSTETEPPPDVAVATSRNEANAEAIVEQSHASGEQGGGVLAESGDEARQGNAGDNEPAGSDALQCPPGMDPEVFNVLPVEMQQEVVDQARATDELASQLDAGSSLDPEALAALPEDMRREVIAQEQRERRMREQAPADPANAEEMDNASFVASLAPELRNEILMTADDAFLHSLPPNIIAEAQILRERASSTHRGFEESSNGNRPSENNASNTTDNNQRANQAGGNREQNEAGNVSSRRKQRSGKIRIESDRESVVFLPQGGPIELTSPIAKVDLMAMMRLMYLLSPIRPHRLLQRVFQNVCSTPVLRHIVSSTFIKLLHDDNDGAKLMIDALVKEYSGTNDWRAIMDRDLQDSLKDFPPLFLIGAAPEVLDTDGMNPNITLLRRKQTNDTAASIAANLPMSARGSRHEQYLPPVVATRIVDTLQQMCKNSPRFSMDILVNGVASGSQMEDSRATGFEKLLDLLEKPRYSKSSANLEQLLTLLESAASPLSHLSKHSEDDMEITQKDMDAATAAGKEWADVPRIVVSQQRLQLLCSILRMETCKDGSFMKVNTIARRLCRVDANRGYVLAELASVARALGADAMRDLKSLGLRLASAVNQREGQSTGVEREGAPIVGLQARPQIVSGSASSSIAVSTSTSELKLLRVLQTLQALCADLSEETPQKKSDGLFFVTDELVQLLHAMDLDNLWAELTACLKIVQVLEGVTIGEDADKKVDEINNNEGDDENAASAGKKLQNSVAGMLTRFLPSIEAFFVANASATRALEKSDKEGDSKNNQQDDSEDSGVHKLVGGNRLVSFVSANKILLNALIRNNASLLDKGLKALIQVPRCRQLLDFDVKRHWFKTQVRRLRQQASRRHGSLRLHIRRKHVFEDSYHQLRLRNADEMRGRLHITFRNEQGVDAGGLSREFFGILAKEIFNPDYALFTSTEDGSTFQPNQHSIINPDHLSYFRFVGRIVGKAVADGYLLDAHFTRSLYKHMLGLKPTHHDMEAIDPDYYKNLKTILEYDLGDLGLDLTFSIEDHSFGRNRIVDLIDDGRNVPVTEQNKAKYVSLVCQYRMTTAISSQIKSYLDGFYELVSKDLIAVFTPRELELLISGLPDIDVHDLKRNTDYVGWKAADKQIQWFWNVLFSLTRNQKVAFLQFVTGSSKVPLAGFAELPGTRGVQKFSIHKASGSTGALASAHTCFNSLDLPVYNSEEELREKLLYAINEGVGSFLLA